MRNREADGMLGAALRDEDDGDAVLPQRAEQPLGSTWHADHAGAFDVDERNSVDARDALHGMCGVWRFADERSRFVRRKRVSDPDWNPFLDRRRHGLRMDDLGAEVR